MILKSVQKRWLKLGHLRYDEKTMTGEECVLAPRSYRRIEHVLWWNMVEEELVKAGRKYSRLSISELSLLTLNTS